MKGLSAPLGFIKIHVGPRNPIAMFSSALHLVGMMPPMLVINGSFLGPCTIMFSFCSCLRTVVHRGGAVALLHTDH